MTVMPCETAEQADDVQRSILHSTVHQLASRHSSTNSLLLAHAAASFKRPCIKPIVNHMCVSVCQCVGNFDAKYPWN